MHCHGICLEGLEETAKDLRIVGGPSESRSDDLLNTSEKRYRLSQLIPLSVIVFSQSLQANSVIVP
jgi:hypothetical protein